MKNKNINCFTPVTTKKPVVGDIIFGEEEFIVGKKKEDEDVIEVGLKQEDCIVEETKYEQIVSKGTFLFNVPYTSRTDKSIIDESRRKSTWVVVEIENRKKVKLLHSTLPESYRVKAKRLIDGKIDEFLSETIEFYTCGSNSLFKNIVDKKFEVIGKMKI